MIKVLHHLGQFNTIDGWPTYCIKNNKIYCYVIDRDNQFYIFIRGIAYEAEQTQFSFPLLALLPSVEIAENKTVRGQENATRLSTV